MKLLNIYFATVIGKSATMNFLKTRQSSGHINLVLLSIFFKKIVTFLVLHLSVMDAEYLVFSKAFNKVPHHIIVVEVAKCRLADTTMR